MVQSDRQQSDACAARCSRHIPVGTFYGLDHGEGLRLGPRPARFRVRSFPRVRYRRVGLGQSFDLLCACRRGSLRQSRWAFHRLDRRCWRRLRRHRERGCSYRIPLHEPCYTGLRQRRDQFRRGAQSRADQRSTGRYCVQIWRPFRHHQILAARIRYGFYTQTTVSAAIPTRSDCQVSASVTTFIFDGKGGSQTREPGATNCAQPNAFMVCWK